MGARTDQFREHGINRLLQVATASNFASSECAPTWAANCPKSAKSDDFTGSACVSCVSLTATSGLGAGAGAAISGASAAGSLIRCSATNRSGADLRAPDVSGRRGRTALAKSLR